MPANPFEKDFSYLIPFLNKLEAFASSLPDAAAREELTQLVATEKQRWARIDELVSQVEERSAVSAQLLDELPQHAFGRRGALGNSSSSFRLISFISRAQQQVVLQFAGRPHGISLLNAARNC